MLEELFARENEEALWPQRSEVISSQGMSVDPEAGRVKK